MNQMLPQPPPDAPMPPPSEQALRSRKWRNGMIAVGIFSVIVTLGLLAAPMVIRRPHYHDLTEAISNLRMIGLALYEFEVAYGQMPDDSTLAKVEAAYPGTGIPMGTKSSNDYFRQLIVSEIASNESMFYARFPGTKKPDNVITAGRALEKGGQSRSEWVAGSNR